MNITEYAIAKKLFGGGKRGGTAIPAGEDIDRIFFNIGNTTEETNAILSKLTFVQTPLLDYPIYIVYARAVSLVQGEFYIVLNLGGEYLISCVTNAAEGIGADLYNSLNGNGSDGVNGWSEFSCDLGTVIPGGTSVYKGGAILTDVEGIPVGLENDKIKNVLSITPF